MEMVLPLANRLVNSLGAPFAYLSAMAHIGQQFGKEFGKEWAKLPPIKLRKFELCAPAHRTNTGNASTWCQQTPVNDHEKFRLRPLRSRLRQRHPARLPGVRHGIGAHPAPRRRLPDQQICTGSTLSLRAVFLSMAGQYPCRTGGAGQPIGAYTLSGRHSKKGPTSVGPLRSGGSLVRFCRTWPWRWRRSLSWHRRQASRTSRWPPCNRRPSCPGRRLCGLR